eukprot:372143_1
MTTNFHSSPLSSHRAQILFALHLQYSSQERSNRPRPILHINLHPVIFLVLNQVKTQHICELFNRHVLVTMVILQMVLITIVSISNAHAKDCGEYSEYTI